MVKSNLSSLGSRLQTTRADILPYFATTFVECSFLDIWLELSLRMFHREANIVPKLGSLATNLAFSHNHTSIRQIKSDQHGSLDLTTNKLRYYKVVTCFAQGFHESLG
jgi:hypothetical protein